MKSLSCMSLSRTQEEPMDLHRIPIDEDKDNTRTAVLGHSKGPKIQTLVEVLRCELGRPGRSSTEPTEDGLGPTKQWTPLYYAVYHKREAALVHFLRAGQSPDEVAGTGQPPLCIAVAAGHTDIVRLLCEAGANIKAVIKHNGETALHLAIKSGQNDVVDILLSHGPDLNARTSSTGETPLHYAAAKSGSLTAVVALLKRGASYESLDTKGCSPAEVALRNQNLHSAVAIVGAARGKRNKLVKEKEMLLKHVEKAQSRFSMNNDLIADIFEAGCPYDSTVLVEAIKRDDAGLVEMFLGKGADPNRATATGLHPLFAALDCSGAQVVQALVKHGADVTLRDPHGLTVLQAALESPSAHDKEAISGIFEALLSKGADPKVRFTDGTTLLHRVVKPGLELARVTQLLLQAGVKVNEQEKLGNSALHVATHSKSCIAVLLKNGADANLANNKGLTPLLQAIKSATKEDEPDLEQLIKASDTRKVNSGGKTALHLAAQNGLDKTVRLLLAARVETTSIDSKKRTPLLLAVLNQRWTVVPLLAIQPGINSWDEEGQTALHHIAMSIPKAPSTWKHVVLAASPFCAKGVSRSMRDRSGATPLIQAIKTLPEEGLPVIEMLLSQRGSERNNCVGHEDHKPRSALYYAATLAKPSFVEALLKNGAPFTLQEWKPKRGPIKATTAANKQILKHISEYEWLKRAMLLRRQSSPASEEAVLPTILPIRDLNELLSMGLDPNGLPKSKFSAPLLWVVLHQTLLPPPLPPHYLQEALQAILAAGGNANTTATRGPQRTSNTRSSPQLPLSYHSLTFILEQFPSVDIDLITLFLQHGSKLSIASPFYDGRYPLHSAVQGNRIDLVDEFLTRKTDPNCPDGRGRTPLFIAAEKDLWEIAGLLLRFGTKPDIKDREGNTALHVAVMGGNESIASRLLRAGAKACAENRKGATPLGLVSADKEQENLIALLKNAEEQERRYAARNGKDLERSAIEEGKERRRKELEVLQQKSKSSTNVASRPPPQSSVAPALQHLKTRSPTEANSPHLPRPGVSPLQNSQSKAATSTTALPTKKSDIASAPSQPKSKSLTNVSAVTPKQDTPPIPQQLTSKSSTNITSAPPPTIVTPPVPDQKQKKSKTKGAFSSLLHKRAPAPAAAAIPATAPILPDISTTSPTAKTPLAPPVDLSKQVISVRYTPPSPKRQQANTGAKVAPSVEQPLPQPRVDSSFSLKQTIDKPLPELNRNQGTFDHKGEKAEPNGDELASWLALSKMMDRL